MVLIWPSSMIVQTVPVCFITKSKELKQILGIKFLSETTRPRAWIFGMQHHIVDLYQVFQIMARRKKMGLEASHVLHRLILGKHKKSSSETTIPRVLIIGMSVASPSGTLPCLFKLWFLGQKMTLPRSSHIFFYRENLLV